VPEGVALPPGLGAEVPPFGVVVTVLGDWVGVVATVDCVVVAIGSMGAVVLELLFELSPTTMIRPTTSPITTATRMLIVHLARVFMGAMLDEDPAEDPERLVDLGLADHQRR
jgi:hypothetical protein